MPIKIASFLSYMANRSAPGGFREKSGAYEKSLEVSEILHMGCAIGNSVRLLRRRPALSPLLLYHIEAGLSIGNLHKKKESFSTLFHNAVNDIEDGKLFVTVEAGAEFLNVFPISSAGVIHFVFFASAVRAFDFHFTTNSFPNPQGCSGLRLLLLRPHTRKERAN